MTVNASPEIMQQIMAAASNRRLDDAALLAARAVQDHPDDTRLAALSGAIEFQRGQHGAAAAYLEIARHGHPTDVTIRGNLAESLYHIGRMEEAEALCDDAAIAADPSLRLLRLGAFFAQERQDFTRAAELYRKIVALEKADWSSWNNLGNALSGLGQAEAAIDALQTAVRLDANSAPIRINLANALFAAGRFDEAETMLKAMVEADPQDHAPLLSLFAAYRDAGRTDDAYAAIAEAARRAPDNADIRSDHGQEAARQHDYDIAEIEFEAALVLNPRLGPSYVGLGSLYERMNREDEVEPLLERAQANQTDPESAAYIEALIHKRSEDFEAAFDALERSGDVVVPGRKFHLRGVMLDRLKRHDEAFDSFLTMNAHWQQDPTQPTQRAAMYRDAVASDTALIQPDWLATWTAPPPPDDWPTPTFLVGFPRSGTTLLDTMLMREPRALVLEEEPFLTELESRVGGITAFPDLDAKALREGRDFYFGRVAEQGGVARDTFLVDKHPLHLNKVAVCRRFFPDAKFILALRHPCDVVFSCFLTNFQINNAMANFLDLSDAAALYDLTFRHWENARRVFDLPVSTVVYERLIEDTSRELRPLFDWLGLDWPGDELDHREAARARGVVYTASYAQVTEPIYKRAAGRWHNYSAQLEPVYDRLRPWVEKFGYSLDDGRIPGWPATEMAAG